MNDYRVLVVAALASSIVSGFSTSVSAADFVGKMALGKKSSELIIRERSFNPDFVTLFLSLTASIERVFVTVDHEFSIEDDIETDPGGLIFYSREDTNITVGYGFDDFAVFTGFRTGATDAHYTGNNEAFGTSSDGYYVGISAGYFFEGKGNLSASIAIASLDGEVSLTEPFVDTTAFTVSDPPENIQGSAVGYSLAVSWQGEVSADTLYSIDLKINQFDFEDDVVFGGVDLSYEENFSTVSIGLTHFFE